MTVPGPCLLDALAPRRSGGRASSYHCPSLQYTGRSPRRKSAPHPDIILRFRPYAWHLHAPPDEMFAAALHLKVDGHDLIVAHEVLELKRCAELDRVCVRHLVILLDEAGDHCPFVRCTCTLAPTACVRRTQTWWQYHRCRCRLYLRCLRHCSGCASVRRPILRLARIRRRHGDVVRRLLFRRRQRHPLELTSEASGTVISKMPPHDVAAKCSPG